MENLMKSVLSEVLKSAISAFERERWLVLTGLLGFILSAGAAVYIYFQGPIILPEGNMRDAFSFNAALGIFLLSIAAILPFARLGTRKRKAIRWFFITAALYSYAIENVQNFRGISPRFSREGALIDVIGGMLFGGFALVLVISALLLMISFFRIKPPYKRPLLIIGIRYALLSVLISNLAGIWMSLLQGRFTGDEGNLIVLHGMGFHSLQTLIIPGWLLEKTQLDERVKKWLIRYGGIAWTVSVLLIGLQTAIGRTVFELTVLPVFSCILLLVWLGTAAAAFMFYIKGKWTIRSIPQDKKIIN